MGRDEVQADVVIVGAGILGLCLAREIRRRFPKRSVCILEKEAGPAYHSSGRNSGVLHAGFYYTADSLKARFTMEGNRLLKQYCRERGLRLNECGKVVVATDENELSSLLELKRRGDQNGSGVRLVDEAELAEIEPNARTFRQALYSPETATVDPEEVCGSLRRDLEQDGVKFYFHTPYSARLGRNAIRAGNRVFTFDFFVNAGGLYADQIARDFGCSQRYVILPFKGIYLKYRGDLPPVRTNVYPVPNLKNPFLGVHFTVTAARQVKLGPTAIPAFWRENYSGLGGFSLSEFAQISAQEISLFARDAFGFRRLALEEMKKYRKKHFVGLARKLVRELDENGFREWSKPGIRPQLLNRETSELVQDFVVEHGECSTHILNAISPAFTSSMPFSAWVVDQLERRF